MAPSDASIPSLLARVVAAGGHITTNGQSLRVREWAGPLPGAILGEIQLRRREIYDYLMGANFALTQDLKPAEVGDQGELL